MASPGGSPGQLEPDVSDVPVSDHEVPKEHGEFNNPTQSNQPLPTDDPPTTAEAVLRILTAVENISSKINQDSDDNSLDQSIEPDGEPAPSLSETREESM